MNLHGPAGALIVSLAVLVAACDSKSSTPNRSAFTAPSPFGGPAPFVGASLASDTIGFTSVTTFGCPWIAPFTTSFSVLVDQRSRSDIFMDRASLRFVDGSGLPSPLELTRADLTGMFGTTLVPGGTTRRFEFEPDFGCGFVSVPTSLFVELLFLDRNGARHNSRLTATVR
jgi:hypothetical protein